MEWTVNVPIQDLINLMNAVSSLNKFEEENARLRKELTSLQNRLTLLAQVTDNRFLRLEKEVKHKNT